MRILTSGPLHHALVLVWLVVSALVCYSKEPVISWLFIGTVFALITITTIAAIKDPRPPYPRPRK